MYMIITFLVAFLLFPSVMSNADTQMGGVSYSDAAQVQYKSDHARLRNLAPLTPTVVQGVLNDFKNKITWLPQPVGRKYPPPYDRDWDRKGKTFASVNSGKTKTFLLGEEGGIDAAFATAAKDAMGSDADLKSLAADMEAAFNLSASQENTFACLPNLRSKAAKICGKSGPSDRVGSTIIVQFPGGVYGVPENRFMVYTVPPKPIRNVTDLDMLSETMKRSLDVVMDWNAKEGLDDINFLRVCLVSGRVRKGVSFVKEDIARSIIKGIAEALQVAVSGLVPHIQLTYADGAFKGALKMIETDAANGL